MAGSIASAVGSAAVSYGANKLLGGGKKSSGGGGSQAGGGGPGLLPFTAGGIEFKFDKNGTPFFDYSNPIGAQRLGYLSNQQKSFTDQANTMRGYIPQIQGAYGEAIGGIQSNLERLRPGFGALTDARVNAIRDEGARAGSDLKSNLAKRRVLGSSFAEADISTQRAEFAKKEAEARAASYLEELDATTKLIGEKLNFQTAEIDAVASYIKEAFSLERASDQVQLDELNKQFDALTSMISGLNAAAQRNAQTEAEYAAQGAANRGKLIAPIASAAGDWLGEQVQGWF